MVKSVREFQRKFCRKTFKKKGKDLVFLSLRKTFKKKGKDLVCVFKFKKNF